MGGIEGLIAVQPNLSLPPSMSSFFQAVERSLQRALPCAGSEEDNRRQAKWPLPSLNPGCGWRGQTTQKDKSKLELSGQ